MSDWDEDLDGYFESFTLTFDAPLKYFKWAIIKAIVFIWLPLCPGEEAFIGAILQVKRRRFWLRADIYDFIDSKKGRGVPFDTESKSFDMTGTFFRYHRRGRIANMPQVTRAVFDRLAQIMQSI